MVPRGLRAVALIAGGGLALHKLRYLLGYGAESDHALASHGHEYLHAVVPFVGLLLAAAAGHLIAAFARRRSPRGTGPRRPSLGRLWVASTLALLAVYAGQELAEGIFAPGHPAGLAALLAGGGAWAVPLAAAIGLVVALVARGVEAALAAPPLAARFSAHRTNRRSRLPVRVDFARGGILARHLAGRAPPIHSG